MNRTTFFAYARKAPFGGSLWQTQVEGITAILDEWERRGLKDDRWLAYILATAFHETGGKMQPIKEKGGDKYLSKYDTGRLAKNLGNTPQADGDGQKYAGRGFVQITGRANYRKFGIEANPDRALEMGVAIKILFDGMINGSFTGKRLVDYFEAVVDDPQGARRIVNGTDKAKLIAGYHKNFLDAITAAHDPKKREEVVKADAEPDDKPVSQSPTAVLTTVAPAGAGVLIPAVTGIDNPYSLALCIFLIIVGCVAGYMFFTGRFSITRTKAL